MTGLMITGPAAAAANCEHAVSASRRAKYWLMPTRAVMTSSTASAVGGDAALAPLPCGPSNAQYLKRSRCKQHICRLKS